MIFLMGQVEMQLIIIWKIITDDSVEWNFFSNSNTNIIFTSVYKGPRKKALTNIWYETIQW